MFMRQAARLLATVAITLGLAAPAAAAPNPNNDRPIDLVICLDVSGSMSGLIDSAKRKIWDIVNTLGKARPTPVLRVALLTYGHSSYDQDAGWVRVDRNLSTDLDGFYKQLFELGTKGGTEYVGRVSHEALKTLAWSPQRSALKIMFVCGNESVAQDPVIDLGLVAKLAKQQDVLINTIYCGPKLDRIAPGWKAFAESAGGEGTCIDQNAAGREVVIATPFDKELLVLNGKLNRTYLCYGLDGLKMVERQRVQDTNAANLSPSVALARTASKATAQYRNSTWDLIDRMKNDSKFKLEDLKTEQLPEELRKLKLEERTALLKKKAAEREVVQKKIQELSKKRAQYIREHKAKQPKPKDKELAFDEAVQNVLIQQCQQKGLEIRE